jgi:hypothetical protein
MDEGLSQNDLDNLFGDILTETKKSLEVKEVKNIEILEGNEILTQDQIDEMPGAFQNDYQGLIESAGTEWVTSLSAFSATFAVPLSLPVNSLISSLTVVSLSTRYPLTPTV